ncbi:LysM peptidoglycan-binding domain-containing protein [Pontimonas sp.]|uniref:LysM peptidoglycan-binding domain-containing protein n=1 Tax=Pontimonas sp. TaxID=2304492 RepID=UPI0028702473|nr:LysM peptidoglycan-binding domain-containing protein [Pontimonas sp.]MDR9433876.1 LysM peptidoglycan-binding domain-containing protein [Pontimonas sp.]
MSQSPEHDPTLGRTPRDDHFFFGDPLEPQHAPEILRGLRPRHSASSSGEAHGSEWTQRTMRGGLPLLMTGSLAAGVGVTDALPTPMDSTAEKVPGTNQPHHSKNSLSEMIAQAFVPLSQRIVSTVAPSMPDTYTVRSGETLTSVAEKFQIPTALLLSLNGLSWNSILHEGQVLRLTMAPSKQRGMAPPRVSATGYQVESGDTLAGVAERLGVSERALAVANGLEPGATLSAGTRLTLPGTPGDMAPRTVASTAPASSANVVLASVANPTNTPADTAAAADTDTDTADDAEGDDRAEQSESADPQEVNPHPLAVDVLDAPELRPEKKPTPTPPPAPVDNTPEPTAQSDKDDRDDDTDDDSDSKESSDESADESSERKPVSGAVTPLNDVRRGNASVIVQVGRDLGIPDYGIVIALATAMQESSLRNIDWGDRDSVGLYQQRTSSGWGTVEEIMDPAFASKAFYGGPSNPNPGRTRGLLDYSGWQSMDLTVAAQKVQRSAYPEAYAKWEASAWAWLEELS